MLANVKGAQVLIVLTYLVKLGSTSDRLFEVIPEATVPTAGSRANMETTYGVMDEIGVTMRWGPRGHALTAKVANRLLSPATRRCVHSLVPQIGQGARWPDIARKTAAYKWSGRLHYAGTPDWDCDYKDGDCDSGNCVVTALSNFTHRLQDSSLSLPDRAEALRFVLHLVGDIHQPLHLGFAADRGGNLIKGRFLGIETNLHEVWDDAVIDKRVRDDFAEADGRFGSAGGMNAYTSYLMTGARAMQWTEATAKWEPKKVRACGSGSTPLCPKEWAQESAELACSHGYRDGKGRKLSVSTGFDFDTTDYQRLLKVVEGRITQGAVRLAKILETSCVTAPTRQGKDTIVPE